ncbi:hypothetical protein GQ44DRAFT_706672 [Phaeosphaeriaceae sp. PMI808]|nr:hypothetical protein GQ44DRAFT_706672 [Phaeosphaeriaceae sp. PMI808]
MIRPSSTVMLITRAPLTRISGDGIHQMIYKTHNITSMIYALTHKVNIALRSYNTFQDPQDNPTGFSETYISPKERFRGSAWVSKTHVRVRWAWMTVPAMLILLVSMLLVATAVLSGENKVGIWKDNPLALLLFRGWEEKDRPVAGNVLARTEKQIRDAARRMEVRLGDGEGGDGEGGDGGGMKGTIFIGKGRRLEKGEEGG